MCTDFCPDKSTVLMLKYIGIPFSCHSGRLSNSDSLDKPNELKKKADINKSDCSEKIDTNIEFLYLGFLNSTNEKGFFIKLVEKYDTKPEMQNRLTIPFHSMLVR